MDGIISGFGCSFYWEASHSVWFSGAFLFQSRVKTNTLRPTRDEKKQISPCIWNLNGGPVKQTAVTALCTCRKQLILIPLHHDGSCLDQCQQHREKKDEGWTSEKMQLDSLATSHIKAFSSPVTQEKQYQYFSSSKKRLCSLCHNKEHKTEMGWETGRLILCQAICSDLTIQFRWPQVLWCTKTQWITYIPFDVFHLPSSVDSVNEQSLLLHYNKKRGKWFMRSCGIFVIWPKQMIQLMLFWILFVLRGFGETHQILLSLVFILDNMSKV